MEVSDRVIWVGKSKHCLGNDNILYISAVGDIDENIAAGSQEVYLRFSNLVDSELNAIVDLNNAGKVSRSARKIFTNLMEKGRKNKIAFYGLNPVSRVIASFLMIGNINRNFVRFFRSKEDAISWLKN